MKKYLAILLLVLAGCTTGKLSDTRKWGRVENLTGEPLVVALISIGNLGISEINENRRNVRLDIEKLRVESKTDEAKKDELFMREIVDERMTAILHERALQEKSKIWKAIQKE